MHRLSLASAAVAIVGVALLLPGAATAQDFAVETQVFVDEGGVEALAGTGVTLSHGGRVYDYSDATGEILIYVRADRHFEILNPGYGVRTEASLEEIDRHLARARRAISEYAEELRDSNDPAAVRTAARVDVSADEAKVTHAARDRFAVDVGPVRYDVTTTEGTSEPRAKAGDVAVVYADFADEAHRLGYVLHPRPVPPEVRMRVNGLLRRRRALPTGVRLQYRDEPGVPLEVRTEHVFSMTLTDVHRTMLYQWDALRHGASLKTVALRQYVKTVHGAKDAG